MLAASWWCCDVRPAGSEGGRKGTNAACTEERIHSNAVRKSVFAHLPLYLPIYFSIDHTTSARHRRSTLREPAARARRRCRRPCTPSTTWLGLV